MTAYLDLVDRLPTMLWAMVVLLTAWLLVGIPAALLGLLVVVAS